MTALALMSEDVLQENERALASFAAAENAAAMITPPLVRILEQLRQTGVPYYPWPQLRALLVAQLKAALEEMHQSDHSMPKFDERRSNVAAQLDSFEGPPFTLQRLAEVILEPRKTYKSLPKLFNALEKLLAVTSTIQVVDPRNSDVVMADDEPEPPAPPSVTVNPVAAPTAQVVQGNAELGVVAKAPWASGEGSS